MKKKALIILLMVLLGSVGFVIFNSRAEEEINVNTHSITIKNETNKETNEEFTYRVKAWKENYYYTIGNIDENGDGSISIGYLFNSIEDYNNNNNLGTANNSEFEVVKFFDKLTINGGDRVFSELLAPNSSSANLSEDKFYYKLGIINNCNYPIDDCSAFIRDDNLKEIFKIANTMPVMIYEYWPIYKTLSYVTLGNGKSYALFISPMYGEVNDFIYYDTKFYIYSQKNEYLDNLSVYSSKFLSDIDYIDFTDQLGNSIEENTYEFTLNSGESKEINIPEGYTIEIEEVPLDGWMLESINDNRDITRVEEEVIGDKTYTFKNRSTNKETYTITTHHYKEGTTEKVSEDVVKTLEEDSEYETSSVNISGYELVNSPDNATGVADGNKEVIYYYKEIKKDEVKPHNSEKEVKEKVKIIVHHMDKAGNKLDEDEVMIIDKGSRYITGSSSKLKGYTVIRPDNYEGVATSDIELTYIYSKSDKLLNPFTGNGGLISYILIFLLTLSMLITYSISKRNSRL